MIKNLILYLKLKITGIFVAILFSFSSSFSFADTVNILGLFPFSGPYADSGKLTDQGARIALEEVNYTINGKKIKYPPYDNNCYAQCIPIYKTFSGWKNDCVFDKRCWKDLPLKAREYIQFIEKSLGVDVDIISTGPERNQNIVVRQKF